MAGESGSRGASAGSAVFQYLVDPNASGSSAGGLGGGTDWVGWEAVGDGDGDRVGTEVGLGDGDSERGGTGVGRGGGERAGFEQVGFPLHRALWSSFGAAETTAAIAMIWINATSGRAQRRHTALGAIRAWLGGGYPCAKPTPSLLLLHVSARTAEKAYEDFVSFCAERRGRTIGGLAAARAFGKDALRRRDVLKPRSCVGEDSDHRIGRSDLPSDGRPVRRRRDAFTRVASIARRGRRASLDDPRVYAACVGVDADRRQPGAP